MGIIYNIQRFSLHDGPGIRTTVFLKGCPLRCAWCHNPESQSVKPQLSLFAQRCMGCGRCAESCGLHQLEREHHIDHEACRACGKCAQACAAGALEILGREASAEEIVAEAARDLPFYQASGGGMTLSGGEPTMQSDFAAQILALAKAQGIHTAMETCGYAPWSSFEKLLPHLDLLLYDVKHLDPARHKTYTGVDNALILDNLRRLCESGKDVVVRVPVIPGYNDQRENIVALTSYLIAMSRPPRVEMLPYNELAGSKYPRLGMVYAPGEMTEADGNAPDELCRVLTDAGLNARVMR